jgi:glycosyltransferase involved in cell wall biosynthesis
MKGISIVICCYNSTSRIEPTLRHLSLQKTIKEISWEIILVDNHSTDDTAEFALNIWQKTFCQAPLKIVYEQEAGLSFARERGVKEASYNYILFCDDDNRLRDDYVETAFTIMEGNEKIGALGGQSDALSDIAFPEWWEQYKDGYAVGKQAINSGDVSSRKYLWGAGLVVRKELLQKVFDEHYPLILSDRKGNVLTSGGDSEICHRILLLGKRLFYDEQLFYTHYIPAERLSPEYRTRLFDSFIVSSKVFEAYDLVMDYTSISLFQKWKLSLKLISKRLLMLLHFRQHPKENVADKLAIILAQPKLAKNKDISAILQFLTHHS